MSFKILFGERIRFLRKQRGMTQEVFAELLGVDRNSLGRMERGVTFPEVSTFEKIHEVLSLPYYEIFNLESHVSQGKYGEDLSLLIASLSEQEASYFLSCVKAFLKLKNQGK